MTVFALRGKDFLFEMFRRKIEDVGQLDSVINA